MTTSETNVSHAASNSEAPESGAAPLFGILAEYSTPGEILEASTKVRDAGFRRWDTFTPFPVHGIDRAMGIKMTALPWIVLCAALTGLATATLMQWWMNAYDYKFLISGKPFWSVPANVPIMFELTVLFSAFAALGGMLILNRLPHPSHPLDLKERFAKATDDKFFLLVQADDAKFDAPAVRALLEETKPLLIDDVPDDTRPNQLPRVLIYGMIILTVAALVPLALFAKARYTKSRSPRIHAIWDMDFQPKYKAQRSNPLFDDGRAMREPVSGTVAVGHLDTDDHLHRGKIGDAFARTFPRSIEPTMETMERGKQRYEIFCAPCHGFSGAGDGMVHQRAATLTDGSWAPPTDLRQAYLRETPVGELFDSITNGVRNMPAYGRQVSVQDRWAILMYVRALQKSRVASVAELTAEERAELK